MASRQIILIAGMHRSGTSALARAVNLAGVPLPDNLMPPAPDNTDGFWEPMDVVGLHDRILRSLDSNWDDHREIPADWFVSEDARLSRGRIAEWIESEIAGKDLLLVKDPRVCRLLPLWQDACAERNVVLHTIIPFRNPIEVAGSLKRRNQFPPLKSVMIWLRHFIDAERFSRGRSRCFVGFDELMNGALPTIRRIERELGLALPVPDTELGPVLDEALKSSLRHHVATSEDLAKTGSPSSPPMIVYPWALAAAAGKNPPPSVLDEVAGKLREVEEGRSIPHAPPS
jgi:hypothetical protein